MKTSTEFLQYNSRLTFGPVPLFILWLLLSLLLFLCFSHLFTEGDLTSFFIFVSALFSLHNPKYAASKSQWCSRKHKYQRKLSGNNMQYSKGPLEMNKLQKSMEVFEKHFLCLKSLTREVHNIILFKSIRASTSQTML